MSSGPDVLDLGDEEFVSLTTFRRSGDRVSTPVWIGHDGDALLVTTPAASGKVVRLRRDPRVELRPCGRHGQVVAGAVPVPGVAQVLDDDEALRHTHQVLRIKHGWQFPAVMAVEGLVRVLRRRHGRRVVLRITSS